MALYKNLWISFVGGEWRKYKDIARCLGNITLRCVFCQSWEHRLAISCSCCPLYPRYHFLQILFFISKTSCRAFAVLFFQETVSCSPRLFFQDAEFFSPSLFFQDTIYCSRCFPAPGHLFLSYDINRENWRPLVERRPRNILSTRVGPYLTGLKIAKHLDLHEKNNRSSSVSCKVLLICSPGIII